MIEVPWSYVFLIIGVAVFSLKRFYKKNITQRIAIPPVGDDFDINNAEPRRYRPFAGKKNFLPSMGINNLSKVPEEWLFIENTYPKMTKIRKETTEKNRAKSVHAFDSPRVELAVREFYSKVVDFLLQRYPQYFKRRGPSVYNAINDVSFPYSPKKVPAVELELILAANIEEDFLILMKDDPKDENEEYKLRASVTGFPAGFDPSNGFNKPILFIHKPVPQYASRLKLSMFRFFNKLKPSDMWQRFNWSIQTHNNLFAITGNHSYDTEKSRELNYEEIDFDNGAFLRVERQLFIRLPQLGANVMTVRTYLTPLKQIKDEGSAKELIFAIDNLPEDLAHYKSRHRWGTAVKQYLTT